MGKEATEQFALKAGKNSMLLVQLLWKKVVS
jgi:hypothetical protein